MNKEKNKIKSNSFVNETKKKFPSHHNMNTRISNTTIAEFRIYFLHAG